MRRVIQVDLSEVNDSIAELEAQLTIDVEAIESSLASTDSNVEGLSNAVKAAAAAISSLEDDLVALSNFTHECCDESASTIDELWVANAVPLSGFANDLVLTADNAAWENVLNKPTFFSGSYNDLTNTPTIPSLAGYATETWVSSQGLIIEAASLPSWVATSQNDVSLSGFNNDLSIQSDSNHIHTEYEASRLLKRAVSGNIVPKKTVTQDLGSSSHEWDHVYVKDVEVSDDVKVATISGGASIGSLETPLLNVTGVMSLNGNKITQVGAPDTGTDVVNKSYVDTEIANITIDWDNIGGETKPAMFEEVGYNISSETFIPALNYVYDLGATSSRWGTLHAHGVNAYLSPINAFEGVDAKGKAIVNVADPSDSAYAANKTHVDAEVLNVQIRASLPLAMRGFAHIRVDKLSETGTTVEFRLSEICVTCNSADEYSSPTLRATVLKNANFPHTLGKTVTATPASSAVGTFDSTYAFANIKLDSDFADGYNAMAPVIKFSITRNATRAGIGMTATIAEYVHYHSTLTLQDVYF
eukprot:jgi/Tetstr1/465622/TSEL_010268.t1